MRAHVALIDFMPSQNILSIEREFVVPPARNTSCPNHLFNLFLAKTVRELISLGISTS